MQDDPMDWLEDAEEADKEDLVRALIPTERDDFAYNWPLWARTAQLPPAGDWRVWLVMAGRGFGKTRAGAEWVRKLAEEDPGARIALVAATLNEGRAVMIEGESGVIAVSPPHRAPKYEPSLRRLTWDNGAQAMLYSAGEPESLRGPQHSHAFRAGAKGGDGQRSPHSC
jgi:phage terminase large subunit-like protein